MKSANQYLSVLGLNPSSQYTTNELKDQWRKKCKEHHPDKGGDPEKFRAITHAFKMLTDPEYQVQEAKKRPEKDLNIRMIIPVPFDDAFFGRTILVSFNRVRVTPNLEPEEDQTHQTIDSVRIEIPAKTFSSSEHIFPQKGLICGDVVGDCIVHLQIRPHPTFRADQNGDIISPIDIPMDLALKGGDLEVPTMFGLKTLRIPPGTQPGERLCIGGLGPTKTSKHYVLINPVYPSKEELQQKESWKGLGIQWSAEELKTKRQDEEFEQIFEAMRRASIYGFGSN